MLGDSVEITDGYRTWWSYIPHFMGTPGYVYAYSYGQLLALSVYRAYEEQGDDFVPRYLELLAAGGSRSPQELGAIVGSRPRRPRVLGRRARDRRRAARGGRSGGDARRVGSDEASLTVRVLAMPEHVHVHAPHELSESSEAMTGRERAFEIAAAVMLSLATVAIAWSGYQAARWSGLQAEKYTRRAPHAVRRTAPRSEDRRSGCKTS